MTAERPALATPDTEDTRPMSALRTVHSRAGTAAVLVGVLGAGVLSTGTAYAFWTVTGSGTGSASAASASPLTVTTASAASGLYPGASQSGTVTITNPNPFQVTVTSLSFEAAVADSDHSGCTTTGVVFAAKSPFVMITVPAKGSSGNGSATLAYDVSMSNSSSDGCQGATFTATAAVGGQSS